MPFQLQRVLGAARTWGNNQTPQSCQALAREIAEMARHVDEQEGRIANLEALVRQLQARPR
jgi:hypothetical protein